MKIKQIIQSEQVLARLLNTPAHGKIAFRLLRIKRAVVPVLDDYRAGMQAILEQHGKLNEDGKTYEFKLSDGSVDQAAVEAVNVEHDALLNEKVEIEFTPLSVNDLDKLRLEPPLSANELEAVEWLFTDASS